MSHENPKSEREENNVEQELSEDDLDSVAGGWEAGSSSGSDSSDSDWSGDTSSDSDWGSDWTGG